MLNLTKQQQTFLSMVILLLATGWAVKVWRAGHVEPLPPAITTP